MPEIIPLGEKKCSKCGICKPFSQFRRRKVSKDGLQGQCAECQRKYYSEYSDAVRNGLEPYRRTEPEPVGKTRVCTSCKEAKDVSMFRKRSDLFSGLGSKCKECQAKYYREYADSFDQR